MTVKKFKYYYNNEEHNKKILRIIKTFKDIYFLSKIYHLKFPI